MSSRRIIVRNLRVLTIARLIAVVLTFLSTAYLARVLGPGNFGILGFATSVVAYFLIIVGLGFETYGLREIARDQSRVSILASNIITIRLILAAGAICLYGIMILWIEKPTLVKVILLIQGTQLVIAALSLTFVYQGVQRMGVLALRQLAATAVGLIGVVVLVHRPEDVIVAASITVGAVMFNILWLLTTFAREFGMPRLSMDLAEWRRAFAASLPMAMSALMVSIYYNMDIVMLGFMRSPEETGWYVAAYRIHAAVIIPAGLIRTAFMPALAQTLGNLDAMRSRATHFARVLALVGFPIIAIGMAFSQDILFIVFGEMFREANVALIILMANTLVIFVNTVFSKTLVVWDRQYAIMLVIVFGAVLNIVLNFLLIPRYGIEGAAIATLCTELFALCGIAWLHFQMVHQLYLALFAKVGVCIIVAVAVTKALVGVLPNFDSVLMGFSLNVLMVFSIYIPLAMFMRIVTVREILELLRKPRKTV